MGGDVDGARDTSNPEDCVAMVFKRPGRKTFTFQARTATGWKQLGTRTATRSLAGKIEDMWETLATEHRAWDVLGQVLAGAIGIGQLYDLWKETANDVGKVRRRLKDADLEAIVEEFLAVHARRVKPDSLEHVRIHLRHLLPEGQRFPVSAATEARLTAALYSYQGKRNTLRKVHSSWSVFFEYATDVNKLFERNPMDKVPRPLEEKTPIRFYELDVVERIVAWQPTPERRAIMALLYGTAIEVSVVLELTRGDVWGGTREIRARGTKAHKRDRVSRVADWAWPIVNAHVAEMLPTTRLWPASWNRWTVSDWHRDTVKALALPQRYPLHCARDHWAVRAARAGTPVAVIQQQLGHGSAVLSLEKYGRFLPSVADRAKWEQAATAHDEQRRQAN